MASKSSATQAGTRQRIVKLNVRRDVLATLKDHTSRGADGSSPPLGNNALTPSGAAPKLKLNVKRKREDPILPSPAPSSVMGDSPAHRSSKRRRMATDMSESPLEPPLSPARPGFYTSATSLAHYPTGSQLMENQTLGDGIPSQMINPQLKRKRDEYTEVSSIASAYDDSAIPPASKKLCEGCHTREAARLGYWILNPPEPNEKRDDIFLQALCSHKLAKGKQMADAYLDNAKRDRRRLEREVKELQKETNEQAKLHYTGTTGMRFVNEASFSDTAIPKESQQSVTPEFQTPNKQPIPTNDIYAYDYPSPPSDSSPEESTDVPEVVNDIFEDPAIAGTLHFLEKKRQELSKEDLMTALTAVYRHAFTVAHKTGHYDGWQQGYTEGRQDRAPEALDVGYRRGIEDGSRQGWLRGYDDGHRNGHIKGIDEGWAACEKYDGSGDEDEDLDYGTVVSGRKRTKREGIADFVQCDIALLEARNYLMGVCMERDSLVQKNRELAKIATMLQDGA